MNKILKVLPLCCLAAAVTGCNTDYSGNTYQSQTVGEVSRAQTGTIVSMRTVNLQPDSNNRTGAVLGGVAGAAAGSMFGGGSARYATAIGGAALGAVAGNAIQNRDQDGVEYTIKLDNGSTVVIAQGKTPVLSVGQKVNVIDSAKGRGRVVAA